MRFHCLGLIGRCLKFSFSISFLEGEITACELKLADDATTPSTAPTSEEADALQA